MEMAEVPAQSARSGSEQIADDVPLYEAVAARRTQVDATVWQVPAMSLTGQAFLLSIALGSDTSRTSRALAAALAMVLSLLSMQLMARLRRIEVSCASWLEAYELQRFGRSLHGTVVRDGLKSTTAGGWIAGLRSFRLWMFGLSAFGVVGGVVLVLVVAWPGLLGSS